MSNLFNTLYLWMFRNPFDAAVVLAVAFLITLWSGWAWDEEDRFDER